MILPIDEALAHTYFVDDNRAKIERFLNKGAPPLDQSKSDLALNAISEACYRYKEASKNHFPRIPVDADWYEKLARVVRDFQELLEGGDPHTVNRLLAFLALESSDRFGGSHISSKVGDERATNSRLEKMMDAGRDMLNEQLVELPAWSAAIERAADTKNNEGRPATKTPYLTRSLLHELADIWCRYHEENFVAPELFPIDREWVAPRQQGALFIEKVLREGGLLNPEFDWARLIEIVRIEREDEWAASQKDPDYPANRLKALQDVALQASYRRRFGSTNDLVQ
jgi:hypothetical protein